MRLKSLSFFRLTIVSLAALAVLPGCASLPGHKHRPKQPEASAPPAPHRVGTVAMVNEELRYVLLDVGSLYSPPPGTALKSFSGDMQTGILAVSAEKRQMFIAADIVEGTPRVGDEVKE